MRVMRYIMAVCTVLLLLNGPAQAQVQTRIFDLHNRPAQELVGEIRALYPGNEVHLTAHGQQLVVRASSADISDIARLVQRLDVPPHQLRITVRKVYGDQEQNSAGSRTISTAQNPSHSVVVQDGQGAHVSAGSIQQVPVAVQGGKNPAALLKSVNYNSGFIVRPQFISNHQIELHIIAFDNEPRSGGAQSQTAAVVTIRRVEPGHWVPLGGTARKQQQQQSGKTWQAGGAQENNSHYEVRVEVVQ